MNEVNFAGSQLVSIASILIYLTYNKLFVIYNIAIKTAPMFYRGHKEFKGKRKIQQETLRKRTWPSWPSRW